MTILCGWDITNGLPSRSGRLMQEYELDGVKVLQINVSYDSKMGYLRRLAVFVWFMLVASWVAVRQRDVDVIFASSTPLTIAVPGIIASRVKGRPFVFEVRDLWPEVPVGLGVLRNRLLIALARGLEHLAYRCATHVIACSPGMKDGIVRAGVQFQKVSVIPNGCDNDLFDVPAEVGFDFVRQHPFLRGRPLVVYTGAFGKVNGLDYLVRLAERVRGLDERVAFVLIGSGPEREGLVSLARELGVLNRNLWIMQEIPRKDLPGVLSAATIMVSTVIPNSVMWNNSANKFFDSLAAGRPIAINHGGWLADLLNESGAGIVLPQDDVGKAGEGLVQFLRSKDDLERARRAARSLACERFDRNQLVSQLECVLIAASNGQQARERSVSI